MPFQVSPTDSPRTGEGINTNRDNKVLGKDNNKPGAVTKSSNSGVEQVSSLSFGSSNLRTKPEGYKASKVREMRLTLKGIEHVTSGRALARKHALNYSINIFCK